MAREISDEKRKQMPEEDFAGKGRSFPIEIPEDVHDAAASIGRAGPDNYDAATLKKNIIAIAKRKGSAHVARLPESWKEKEVAACEVRMSDGGPRMWVRLGEVAEGGLKRIPLAVLGKFVKGAQKFAITRQTLADIVANFRKRAADTVIDYEHASEEPGVAAGGPVPAAGWIKAVDDTPDGDGILWGQAEFTPRAQQMIAGKEYRYMSPVINWGARDKVTGEAQGATLTSAALTNRPFLERMPAIAMSDGWEISRGDAGDGKAGKRVTKVTLADRVARTVRVVAEDGTEQTVAVEGLEAQPRVIRLSDVKRNSEGVYDFDALATGDGTLVASEVFGAMQAQAELQRAVERGLITPAQRPHFEKMALSDLAGFRDLVKTLKPQVDLRERGLGADAGEGGELGQVQHKLFAAVAEKQKEQPSLQYHEALKLVASENPELNRRYTELSRKRMTGRDE